MYKMSLEHLVTNSKGAVEDHQRQCPLGKKTLQNV